MSGVAGGFFEVTGKDHELQRIYAGIAANDGRLTADSSASLDLWLDMRDEWFRIHDEQVLNDAKPSTTWMRLERVIWRDHIRQEIRTETNKVIEVVTLSGAVLVQDVPSGTHRMIAPKDIILATLEGKES